MAEERVKRRLAAILAADVVGYSRLMEQDEAGTLATLKIRRKEVLDPILASYQGRIFKFVGDGILAEFSSAVDAVECAVDLQRGMAGANENQPEDRRVVLRIGVNLGDVIVEGDDLYGDGINLAARLEQLAEPGGIFVSATTYDHARNKVKTSFEDLGTYSLKNIAAPVRVYRIADLPQASAGIPKKVSDKPSVAVLPFVNLSGDSEQQYFSDGITEDIITELSRFRSLFVIARNSSFQYRAAADVKQVGRALGVQYVVEGSVRRLGGRVRITAQLIEAATGNHLWAERYDRSIEDLFEVQDEVTQAIAATVEGRMAVSGAQRSLRKPTEDLAAYDYFLQARENIVHRGDAEVAVQLLRRAIELAPTFALAYAWLARVCLHLFHAKLSLEFLHEAQSLARQAVSLDEGDAWGHALVGYGYLFEPQHELAGLHLDRAIALNPVDLRIVSIRALWLVYGGKGDEAAQSLDVVMRRDPFPPTWVWDYLGIALFQARRYEEAVQALNRLTKLERWDCYYLAASYAHLGQMEQARNCGAEIVRMCPSFALGQVSLTEPFKDPADLDHLLEGLRKSGLPE